MYFGQFLVGMSATTIVVAGWAYMATGSFWKALGWTIAVLVLLQVGYFVLVYAMIVKSAPTPADKLREAERKLSSADVTEGEKLGNARRSLH